MQELYSEEDSSGTIFRDIIMLALLGFMTIVILLLPHINPPMKNLTDDIRPPGNVIVEITWDNARDVDVDLWVRAPGDVPVGYSNKSSKIFNLLRDDLGHFNDPLKINYENSLTRGVIPGEYIINIHMYNSRDRKGPIKVKLVISVKKDKNSSTIRIINSGAVLQYIGHEITIVRFKLEKNGTLIPGSINHIPMKLRAYKPQQGMEN